MHKHTKTIATHIILESTTPPLYIEVTSHYVVMTNYYALLLENVDHHRSIRRKYDSHSILVFSQVPNNDTDIKIDITANSDPWLSLLLIIYRYMTDDLMLTLN